jgi:hypothetical protein
LKQYINQVFVINRQGSFQVIYTLTKPLGE